MDCRTILRHLTFAVSSIGIMAIAGCTTKSINLNYSNNPEPLHPNVFIELPLGSIKADGWLKTMLVRQAEGATGHLDELYPGDGRA